MTKGKKRGKGAMCPNNPKMCLLVALNAQIGIIQVMKQNLPSDLNDHITE